MGLRMNKMSKGRFMIYGVALFVVFSVMYFYQGNRDYLQTMKMTEKRCLSEQESLSYQLKVVTEHKAKLEKMISDVQDAQKSDKEKYKDITERCVTMKQQSVLCQSQFDDLQVECKKVRDHLNMEKVETAKLKEEYLHEQNYNNILKRYMKSKQINVAEIFEELKTLRDENQLLNLRLKKYEEKDRPVVNNNRVYRPAISLRNNRHFSQEIEVDGEGLYLIGQTDVHAGGAEQGQPIDVKAYPRSKKHTSSDRISLEQASKLLPPGVPPVLSVDNEIMTMKKTLPKPVKNSDDTMIEHGNANRIAPIVQEEIVNVVAPPPESQKYEEAIAGAQLPGDGILQEDPAGEAEVDDGMMQDEDDEDEETGVE